jgi:hypothetical protein
LIRTAKKSHKYCMDLSNIEPQSADTIYHNLSSAISRAVNDEDLQSINKIFKIIGKYAPSKDRRNPSPEITALNKLRAKGYITKMHLVRDKLNKANSHLGMYRTEMKKMEFDYSSTPLYETWMSDLEVRSDFKQKILRFIWSNKGLAPSYQSIWGNVESNWGVTPIMEAVDQSGIKRLLSTAFPQTDISSLKQGDKIDIVVVEQQADHIIKISVIKHKIVSEISSEDRLIKTTDGNIYLADWHNKERTISTHFITDPQNEVAEQGITFIELQCDFHDGHRIFNGWTIDFPKEDFLTRFNKKIKESASGYIPSDAEKNDPRYKMALSVDIKPDTMQKNAKKFGWKIKRDGTPPQMR